MKVKIILFTWFLTVVVILYALNAFHSTSAPHGGIVKQAGDYLIEMKNNSGGLYVYLLDRKLRPVSNSKVFCVVEFEFSGTNSSSYLLRPYGDDGFEMDLGTLEFYSCEIVFFVDGNFVSAWFENQNPIVRKI